MIPGITLNNGTSIAQLAFGTRIVQPDRQDTASNAEKTAEIFGLALHVGHRHIDSAQQYGTERGVGRAIAASGLARDQVYVGEDLMPRARRQASIRSRSPFGRGVVRNCPRLGADARQQQHRRIAESRDASSARPKRGDVRLGVRQKLRPPSPPTQLVRARRSVYVAACRSRMSGITRSVFSS